MAVDPTLCRIAIGVEYDGTGFAGWQAQANPALPTVQQTLEAAVGAVAGHPVRLACAGRTDAGVHATGQVAHFDCAVDRGPKAWVMGVNSQLPPTVRVRWAEPVDATFHARFAAHARRYFYVIHVAPVAAAILSGRVTSWRSPLVIDAMHAAAQCLVGEQDFSAFQAAGCQSKTPMRCVHWVSVSTQGPFVVVDIQANAFLQHMVRNLVGSLLQIGMGRQPVTWMAALLAGRDRTAAAATAPPDGLYLVDVGYPAPWAFPRMSVGPVFLHGYA